MVPAYTSFGHGQNFVQKDWVNGISSHGLDKEEIGIIIFSSNFFSNIFKIFFLADRIFNKVYL